MTLSSSMAMYSVMHDIHDARKIGELNFCIYNYGRKDIINNDKTQPAGISLLI